MKRWVLISFTLAIALLACGALTAPKTAVDTGNALVCIEQEAKRGESIGRIAVACGVEVADVIADILLSKDPDVPKAPAYGEARRARSKMNALPPQARLELDPAWAAAVAAAVPLHGEDLRALRACRADELAIARDLAIEAGP